MRVLILAILGLWLSGESAASETVRGYFDLSKDGAKFKSIFRDGLSTKELSSVHYAVRGMQYINEPISNANVACQNVATLLKDSSSIEQIYYGVSAFKALQCKDTLNPQLMASAMKTYEDPQSSTSDIMHAVLTLKALANKDFKKDSISKVLQESLKKDDSPVNLANVFHICAEIGCDSWAAERIEDALVQADEVDGKMLHWEGGLPVTAHVLTGILKLSGSEKKSSQITAEQSVKIGNYLLSRKSVQTVKGGSILLESITLLANEKAISPVCITLRGNGLLKVDSDRIQVVVSDLLGRQHPSIVPDNVLLQSATRAQDNVVVSSKQKFTLDSKDGSLYIFDLMKVKPDRGLYKVVLTAGTNSATLTVRILGPIDIDGIEVGVGDVDGSSTPKLTAVKYPNRLATPIEADSLQKVIVKFYLREKGQKQIAKVHQSFVRIFNKKTDKEVIFVAEMDSQKAYKMDVDVGSASEQFNHESGVYGIELIIGDAAISNPIRWVLAEVALKFSSAPSNDAKGSQVVRTMKPEIFHMFREPDPRPPRIVSDIFTCLCIAPMLLLFVLWLKIGINVQNFPFSLSALGFHLGFGAILGLFVVFWLKLTMFETIRYLLALGLITFICGNRLLRSIAAKRKRT